MGRANQPLRAINTNPYVQAMMAAGDSKVRGAAMYADAIKGIGDDAAELGMALGAKKFQREEAQKDRSFRAVESAKNRALQREMQEKGQRLGWAKLQWQKQASLLNQIDDNLKTAKERLSGLKGDAAMGFVNEQAILEAEGEVKNLTGQRQALTGSFMQTGDRAGISIAGMDVDSYLSGTSSGATFTTEEECLDGG